MNSKTYEIPMRGVLPMNATDRHLLFAQDKTGHSRIAAVVEAVPPDTIRHTTFDWERSMFDDTTIQRLNSNIFDWIAWAVNDIRNQEVPF